MRPESFEPYSPKLGPKDLKEAAKLLTVRIINQEDLVKQAETELAHAGTEEEKRLWKARAVSRTSALRELQLKMNNLREPVEG